MNHLTTQQTEGNNDATPITVVNKAIKKTYRGENMLEFVMEYTVQ